MADREKNVQKLKCSKVKGWGINSPVGTGLDLSSVIPRYMTLGTPITSRSGNPSSFLSSLYTSHFTLQTAFIVGIDSNLNIPLSSYL
ncbi:hypothetical protein KAI78_05990 [bacterium]|nr:hypothetical protein [bacterium]